MFNSLDALGVVHTYSDADTETSPHESPQTVTSVLFTKKPDPMRVMACPPLFEPEENVLTLCLGITVNFDI